MLNTHNTVQYFNDFNDAHMMVTWLIYNKDLLDIHMNHSQVIRNTTAMLQITSNSSLVNISFYMQFPQINRFSNVR